MTATTTPIDTPAAAPRRSMAAWAVRQTLLGLLILAIAVGGSAWLLHASIDPAAELPTAATAERPA